MSISMQRRRGGFTLVEILIVVVILGILAAVVIPQFTNASQSARASSLLTQLQTIRSQLALYQVQHNGEFPALADLQGDADAIPGDDWSVMTEKTDAAGTVDAGDLGPYLQKAPVNPFTESSDVVTYDSSTTDDPASAADTNGWFYDENTGDVKAAKFDEQAGEEKTSSTSTTTSS